MVQGNLHQLSGRVLLRQMAVNIEKKNTEAQRASDFLVAVVLRLEWPFDGDANVLGLILFQFGKLCP